MCHGPNVVWSRSATAADDLRASLAQLERNLSHKVGGGVVHGLRVLHAW